MRKHIYNKYINSYKWKEFASAIRHERGNRCENCHGSDVLHCHHMTYERFGNELNSDILVLCEGCHKRYHDQFPSSLMPNMPIEQIKKHVFETLYKSKRVKSKKNKADLQKDKMAQRPRVDSYDSDRDVFLKRRFKERRAKAEKKKKIPKG